MDGGGGARTLKVYKEGLLFKRQRGLHASNTKKLKFQERFCSLTSTSLDYYDPNPRKRGDGPKGQFAVEQLKIVELLPPTTFSKDYTHVMQIGDHVEVMYLAAKSMRERDEWLEAFRRASMEAGNTPFTHCHKGVYGLAMKGRWSCCANPTRACPGCSPSEGYREDLTQTLPSLSPSKTDPAATSQGSPRHPKGRAEPLTPLVFDKTTPDPYPTSAPPFIRSFTIDPIMRKPDPRKLKALRDSKRYTTIDFEHDEKREIDPGRRRKSGDFLDRHVGEKKSLIEVGGPDKQGDDLGELGKIAQELRGNVVLEDSYRSGASSPSPSIDSGKGPSTGGSRPSSQVIATEGVDHHLRTTRTESIGKKSDQSVQSDQGVVPDDNNTVHSSKTLPSNSRLLVVDGVEETDGPQKPASPPVFRSRSTTPDEEHTPTEEEEGRKESKMSFRKISCPNINRVESPNNEKFQTPAQMGHKGVSVSVSLDNIGATANSLEPGHATPTHRSRYAVLKMPEEEGKPRPRSILMSGGAIWVGDLEPIDEYSRLQRACKDGNLAVLEEELNREGVNLEEPSYGPIPYTPLFIAFMYDHFQIMVCLLEHGASPDGVEPLSKASVLHWACERGCTEIVELLLKYNADVNLQTNHDNTPLMAACKNGHLDIVELLLRNGAEVEHEGAGRRTPLHEASDAGHCTIIERLIREGADPIPRDSDDATPYDLAFHKGFLEVVYVLQQMMPESVRPYSLLHSRTLISTQMITTLAFRGNDVLISGSRDCKAVFWDTSTLSLMQSIRLLDTVLGVGMWSQFLVLGSSTIQLVNMHNPDWRRTIADDIEEDESFENPPLHLVVFGPKGRLATASVEGNVVKLWSPPSLPPKGNRGSAIVGIMSVPESRVTIGEEQKKPGCVYSLSMSPTPNCPWMAVGLQPGTMFQPEGNKLVYLLDWESRKVQHIFDAGGGGLDTGVCTMFTPNGQHLAVGSAETLCIWDAKTGALLYKFIVSNGTHTTPGTHITSLCYSPDGGHLAAGLNTGEVQVFEIVSSSPLFTLRRPEYPSPVTALAYSEDGKLFAVGHKDGLLQLWEAFTVQPSND